MASYTRSQDDLLPDGVPASVKVTLEGLHMLLISHAVTGHFNKMLIAKS